MGIIVSAAIAWCMHTLIKILLLHLVILFRRGNKFESINKIAGKWIFHIC